MNAKLSTFRDRLLLSLPLLVASSMTLLTTENASAQQRYYYTSNRTVVPHVVQYGPRAPQVVYYRGTDGRIYGVAAPSPVLPMAVRQAPLVSGYPNVPAYPAQRPVLGQTSVQQPGIVIEDSSPSTVQQPAGNTTPLTVASRDIQPPAPAPASEPAAAPESAPAVQAEASTPRSVDSSARNQAEESLRRFQELQGVQRDSAAASSEKLASADKPASPGSSADETASKNEALPPPKSY